MSEPQQPPVPTPPYAAPLSAQPQLPAQPQHPAGHPYPAGHRIPGQPPFGAPPQHPADARTRNPLARTALIIAVATFAVGLLFSMLTPYLYGAFDYSTLGFGLIGTVSGLITLGGSAAALTFGIIAARRPGSTLVSGIAIGVAGAQAAGIVVGWFSSLLYNFF